MFFFNLGRERYENYKSATTLRAVLTLGGSRADIANDANRGFITFPENAAAAAAADDEIDLDNSTEPRGAAPRSGLAEYNSSDESEGESEDEGSTGDEDDESTLGGTDEEEEEEEEERTDMDEDPLEESS